MVKHRRRTTHSRTDLYLTLNGDVDPATLNRAARWLLKHAQKRPRMLKLHPAGRDTMREWADANIRR